MKPRRNKTRKLKPSQMKENLVEDNLLRESINDIFAKYDLDKDGYIETQELQAFVRHSFLRTNKLKENKLPPKMKTSKTQTDIKEPAFYNSAAERLLRKASTSEFGKINREEMFNFYKKKS